MVSKCVSDKRFICYSITNRVNICLKFFQIVWTRTGLFYRLSHSDSYLIQLESMIARRLLKSRAGFVHNACVKSVIVSAIGFVAQTTRVAGSLYSLTFILMYWCLWIPTLFLKLAHTKVQNNEAWIPIMSSFFCQASFPLIAKANSQARCQNFHPIT